MEEAESDLSWKKKPALHKKRKQLLAKLTGASCMGKSVNGHRTSESTGLQLLRLITAATVVGLWLSAFLIDNRSPAKGGALIVFWAVQIIVTWQLAGRLNRSRIGWVVLSAASVALAPLVLAFLGPTAKERPAFHFIRPQWRHSNVHVRRDAVQSTLTDQAELARVAKSDCDPEVRRYAVQKLIYQPILADIAKGDADALVREAAVEKLIDQTSLLEIGMTDPADNVRELVVKRLTEQTALAEIVKAENILSLGEAALARLSEPSLLAEIAETAANPTLRRSAVERLTDQALLAQIAVADPILFVREAAISRLTDGKALRAIAINGRAPAIRKAAVGRLSDQKLLAQIATTDSDQGVRVSAVDKINDGEVLCTLAVNDPAPAIRKAAVGSLSDQKLLAQIATADSDEGVRESAVARVTNQTTLAEIARKELARIDNSVGDLTRDDVGLLRAVLDNPQFSDKGVLGEIAANRRIGHVSSALTTMARQQVCNHDFDYKQIACCIDWPYCNCGKGPAIELWECVHCGLRR